MTVKLENNTIGILGGTFNPVHKGHEYIIQEVFKKTNIRQVVILPAYQPPHKKKEVVSFRHRFKMLSFVFKKLYLEKKIIISSIEKKITPPNYTYNTLDALKNYCSSRFIFLIGEDIISNISTWYKADDLQKLISFLVFKRGNNGMGMHKNLNLLNNKQTNKNFIYLNNHHIPISSSDIRKAFKNNNTSLLRKYLHHDVFEYIHKYSLYK